MNYFLWDFSFPPCLPKPLNIEMRQQVLSFLTSILGTLHISSDPIFLVLTGHNSNRQT